MPLEQLWAGEIPRLEAEKRAAKQVGCMAREDKDSYGEARHVAQPICTCMARPRMAARRASWQACGTMRSRPRGVAMHFACRRARPTQRCKTRPPASQDRPQDGPTSEALAEPRAVCTELDGARRPIDWTVSATGRDWGRLDESRQGHVISNIIRGFINTCANVLLPKIYD